LENVTAPAAYVRAIEANAYSGFNLLAADGKELWWMSNRAGAPRQLEPGVYGLANLLLDSPDVEANKARFGAVVELAPAIEPLFTLLAEARIVNPEYGTRCSTIYLQSHVRAMRNDFSPTAPSRRRCNSSSRAYGASSGAQCRRPGRPRLRAEAVRAVESQGVNLGGEPALPGRRAALRLR